MRLSNPVSAVLASFGLLLAAPAVIPGQEISKVPLKKWKADDVLRLSVEKWPSAKDGPRPTKPMATYTVDVRHIGLSADSPFWIAQFEPSPRAPRHLRAPCSAWILKEDGWNCVGHLKLNMDEREVLSIDGATAAVRPIEGLPVELLMPTMPKKKYVSDRATLEILREDDGNGVIMVAVIRIQGQDQVQITQTWKKGECWWREYTREINGRKDLHAKFVAVVSLNQVYREKALRANSNAFVTWDNRLQVKVNVGGANPKLSELVDVIQKAAGVTLTLDDSLHGYEPRFGTCQFTNCPAWVVVNFIADQGYHESKWEEHKGGLRLKPANTMTDAGLKKLVDGIEDLEDLTALNLFNTQVTDAGMKDVVRLMYLKKLDLSNTKITDAGLKVLTGFKFLEELNLENMHVTDAALWDLAAMQRLKSLIVCRTRLSSAGLAKLRKSLPGCHVLWSN